MYQGRADFLIWHQGLGSHWGFIDRCTMNTILYDRFIKKSQQIDTVAVQELVVNFFIIIVNVTGYLLFRWHYYMTNWVAHSYHIYNFLKASLQQILLAGNISLRAVSRSILVGHWLWVRLRNRWRPLTTHLLFFSATLKTSKKISINRSGYVMTHQVIQIYRLYRCN